jgi:hypothetical protein
MSLDFVHTIGVVHVLLYGRVLKKKKTDYAVSACQCMACVHDPMHVRMTYTFKARIARFIAMLKNITASGDVSALRNSIFD